MSRPTTHTRDTHPGDYTLTDTEDIRLTSDPSRHLNDVTESHVPLVDQSLTEADQQLLRLHSGKGRGGAKV